MMFEWQTEDHRSPLQEVLVKRGRGVLEVNSWSKEFVDDDSKTYIIKGTSNVDISVMNYN